MSFRHCLLFRERNANWRLAYSVQPSLPEGSEIAFFRDHAAHELRAMPAIGREAKARFAISKDENFLTSTWSLDGKTIAPNKVPARNRLT